VYQAVLADADALWQRAFEAAFDLGDAGSSVHFGRMSRPRRCGFSTT